MQSPVFLVNSRLGLFTAAPLRSPGGPVHVRGGTPSPEVTGLFCRVPLPWFSRSPWYVLPTHLCRFAVRAPRGSLGVFLGSMGSLASPCGFVRRLRLTWLPRFTGSRPTRHRGDVQNPVQLPSCVAPSVVAPFRGCGNVGPLCIGYAFRPRLSPRLTLGGLALPRKPRVHGGRVTLSSLATHASILTPMRSTVGRPPASPPMGSSPTDSVNQNPAASVSSLAPCIVGACPLDQ